VELAHERAHEGHLSRAVSYIYEIGADFGSSLARPIGWFLLSLAMVTVVAILPGAVCAGTDDLHGWQHVLIGTTPLKHCSLHASGTQPRAFVYAVPTDCEPLGVFGPRSTVIANTARYAAGLTALSLSGSLAIVLLAISSRAPFNPA